MKRNILIIEDDVVFGRSMSNWLKKNHMDSVCVTRLSVARKELLSKEYDLVLADLRPAGREQHGTAQVDE